MVIEPCPSQQQMLTSSSSTQRLLHNTSKTSKQPLLCGGFTNLEIQPLSPKTENAGHTIQIDFQIDAFHTLELELHRPSVIRKLYIWENMSVLVDEGEMVILFLDLLVSRVWHLAFLGEYIPFVPKHNGNGSRLRNRRSLRKIL